MNLAIPGWLRRSLATATLVGLAALFGCWSPEASLSPLHTEKDVVLDDTIVGTWFIGEKSAGPQIGQRLGEWKPGDVRFDFARTPGQRARSYVLTRSSGKKSSVVSEVHLLRLQNHLFVNVEPRFPEAWEPPANFPSPMMPVHWFGRITITKNAMLGRMMLDSTIATLQKEGKLPLHRAPQGVLISPTAELQKFALEHADDPKIFPLNVVLCRKGADCAVEVPLAVVKNEPLDRDWYLSLAIGYMLGDRYADAWAAWKQLLAADQPPGKTGASYLKNSEPKVLSLAEAFMDWGYAGSGVSVLKTLTRRAPEAQSFLTLGYGYLHLNRPRQALAAFRKATELDRAQAANHAHNARHPSAPGWIEQMRVRNIASAYILMGEFEKARAEARKCTRNTATCSEQAKIIAFLTYFAEGNYSATVRLLDERELRARGLGIYRFLLLRHLGRSAKACEGALGTGKERDRVLVVAALEEPIEFNAVLGTDQYFRHKLSDSQFLGRIHPRKGRVVVPELCTAYYLAGERHLLSGDRAGARKYFQKSVDTRAYTYVDWVIANARLKQLSGKRATARRPASVTRE